MSQYRFFIVRRVERWTIRGASRQIGAFSDAVQAEASALEVAMMERIRGHAVEVLHQDTEGRWLRLAASSTAIWPVGPDGVAAIDRGGQPNMGG